MKILSDTKYTWVMNLSYVMIMFGKNAHYSSYVTIRYHYNIFLIKQKLSIEIITRTLISFSTFFNFESA